MSMRIESAGERRSRLRVSYPIMEYTTRTESAELHQSEYSPLRLVKVRALCPSEFNRRAFLVFHNAENTCTALCPCCGDAQWHQCSENYIADYKFYLCHKTKNVGFGIILYKRL